MKKRLTLGVLLVILLAAVTASAQPFSAQIQQALRWLVSSNQTITGTWTFVVPPVGAGGSPGGPNTSVQFNSAGMFGGDPDFTYDATASLANNHSVLRFQPGLTIDDTASKNAMVLVDTVTVNVESDFTANGLNIFQIVNGTGGAPSYAYTVANDVYLEGTYDGAGGGTASVYQEAGTIDGTDYLGGLYAYWAGAFAYGASVSTSRMAAYHATLYTETGASVAKAYHFYAFPPDFAASTVTTYSAFHVDDLSAINATNKYAFSYHNLFLVGVDGKLTVPAAGLTIGTSLVTLGGAFTTSGANALTLTTTGSTNVTLPTSGTLATTTDLASYLPLAGGALTGAVTLTRSIGATSTDGFSLINSTAAAAGAQQWSPRLRFTGQGWKTNATAASQTVDWIAELVPVQGAANPSAALTYSAQINAGAYVSQGTWTYDGTTGTWQVYNQLATTGVTTSTVRAGAGQSSTAIFQVVRNDGSVVEGSRTAVVLSGGKTFLQTPILGVYDSSNIIKHYWINAEYRIASDGQLGFSSSTAPSGGSIDAAWFRDGVGQIGQRVGTAAQMYSVANTYTSSTSYERFEIDWKTTANVLLFGTQKGSGGGTARVASWVYGGTSTPAISVPITSGDITFGGSVFPTGYKSADGSAGVTVAACTSFKNGLCVAGT